jgi:hypothetical protein
MIPTGAPVQIFTVVADMVLDMHVKLHGAPINPEQCIDACHTAAKETKR